ncbi:unnamed protein product [Paramecium pentaurelia]|uniref:Kinesin motor domain-containing protein n=1 Tax=Paramecium pentaurelia TaxID=43138 RepID=A0A8S1XQ22_9CILI|nr:unnamed protein product [Paramecium pentaurelia]
MSLNNIFKQKQIERIKEQQLNREQREKKLEEIRKIKSVQFKARQANRVEMFEENKLSKLRETLKEGSYPILPITKHSFRDRYKEKELDGNILLRSQLSGKERARQTMLDFNQGHLATGEFNKDQPHKNHYKWLKVDDQSKQGNPMRFGKGERVETERVRGVIQNTTQKVDYVKKDLMMLTNPTWKQDDKSKWMDNNTFNIYNKKRFDPSSWEQLPINYKNQSNVFIEGFEVLGDPSRKRYKEQEHKRTEYIPTVKEDQIGTTLHISRSLRTFKADQLINEQSNFDEYSQNTKLKYYKSALIETKSIDHQIPYQHSNNFKSLDFKNLRPELKTKIFRNSLTTSTKAQTQNCNQTPLKTTQTKFETEQATTADYMQSKLSKIQEVSQNLIASDQKISINQKTLESENSKSKTQFNKQQSLDNLIKLKYPYHQENDETTKKILHEYFRIRPLNQKETSLINYIIRDQTLQIGEQKFTFDKILDSNTNQQEVYDEIGKPIIDQILQGFNATLLMYGQTSSGKTYTMIGDQQQPGIIKRTINDLFDAIDSSPTESEFRIKIQIVEVYKEKVKDLLDINKQDLKIREMANQGFYIQQITQLWVCDKEEIYNALQKSLVNRQVGYTNLNDMSSRSHLLFQMTVIMNNEIEGTSYTGQLIMADLAGSENASKAGTTGNALQEGAFINRSLLTLSNVINGLSDKQQHVPFRESNLTKLLWNGLSKNSMTSLIITCSPCISNESETLSTLRFGIRAKMIKTQPKVNKEVTIKELEIQNNKLTKELEDKNYIIDQLKKDDNKIKIIKFEELILHLRQENQLLKEQNSQYITELDMKSLDYQEIQTNLKNSLLESDRLQQSNLQYLKQIEQFQLNKDLEIHELNTQIEILKQQLQQKDESIQQLSKHLTNIQRIQTQNSQLQLHEHYVEKIHTQNIGDLLKEIDELKKKTFEEKSEIKYQNKVNESQILVFTKQIKNQESEISNLKEEVKNYQLQLMKNNDELLNLMKQNNKLQKDLENRVLKVLQLQEQYDYLLDQLNKLKNQLNYEEIGIYEENQKLHSQMQEINKKYLQEESLRRSNQLTSSQTLQAKLSRIQQLEQENYQLKLDIQNSQILKSQNNNNESVFISQYQSVNKGSMISKIVKKQQNQNDLQ